MTNFKSISNHKYYKFIAICLFAYLLICLLSPCGAQAQTASSLTVAPARQELLVDPGEQTAVTIKFYNRSEAPVSGLLKVADFIVEDKEGTPSLIEGPSQISPRFSAASWVTLPYDRMNIASKDKVVFQAKINVPTDANPGGRYLAIYFEPGGEITGRPEKETAVAPRLAGLVYLRVSGPVKEDAYVVQMTAPQFSEYGPVAILTEILNRGDYHIRPKGTITVTNLLGRQTDKVKLEEQNIFPDVSRILENKVGRKWMWGKYKAELSAAYGESGQVLNAAIFFWVFPWKVTLIVILAVIIIALLTNRLYLRFKKKEEELEEKVEELEKKLEDSKT